ncbi:MAG: septum formation initiator family protein [Desulfobacteraceae bacterium]|nr:septum formation initiator family protein [Desulfobacteraceae bacterium]
MLLLLAFSDNGLVELHRLRVTHAGLLHENERLTQENLKTDHIISRLQSDPAYMEYIARQELGMVRSDELIFNFKGNPDHKK